MASTTDAGVSSRFLDASEEPNQVLLPIRGYEKEPLLSLEEAVQPLNMMLNDLDMMVDIAKRNSKKPQDGLTPNESAAIHLYTMQWEEHHTSLYTMLNSTLRSERREYLKPWFRYLKLILTALYKLPSLRATVWRGVRGNLSDQYDDDHIWWGFSSCTESVDVMERFVGKSEVRTLFNIECMSGKAIRAHSFFKKENEILLMPGTYLRVVGKWSPSKDLHIIHLREADAPRHYIEPPFTPISTIVPTPETSASTDDTLAIQNLKISKGKNSPSIPRAALQSEDFMASKQPSQKSTIATSDKVYRYCVQLHVHVVDAPGTHLTTKNDIYLNICLLGTYKRTRLMPPSFPMHIDQKFYFDKLFESCRDYEDIIQRLEREFFLIELLQSGISSPVVLASYETSATNFLYPYSHDYIQYTGLRRFALLGRTADFPGISPSLEFSLSPSVEDISGIKKTPETRK